MATEFPVYFIYLYLSIVIMVNKDFYIYNSVFHWSVVYWHMAKAKWQKLRSLTKNQYTRAW